MNESNIEHIGLIEVHYGIQLPPSYRKFLLTHETEDSTDLYLYRAHQILERNRTAGIQKYGCEFLSVGCFDSYEIVIRFQDVNATPYKIDSSALVPNMPPFLLVKVAESWSEWQKNGFSIEFEE